MIEDLLASNKISSHEFKIYKLFTSELGSECLKEMIERSFWEEANPDTSSRDTFSYVEGRRSVIRAIKCTVDNIQAEINKQLSAETN